MDIKRDLKKAMLYVLHWNFFSVVGGLAVAAAVSVVAIQQFGLGYVLFGAAGIWACGHWTVSSFVAEKKRQIRIARPAAEKVKEAKADFWTWLCGIYLLIAFGTSLCFLWVHLTYQKFEKDEVQGHLVMTFSTPDSADVIHSKFSVKNESQFDISERHQILCLVNLMVNDAGYPVEQNIFTIQASDGIGWYMGGGHPPKADVENRGAAIVAHTDAETDSCLSALNYAAPAPIDCIDMVVDFGYYLSDQSEVQHHRERKVFDKKYGWSGQPINSQRDYCFDALSQKEQRERKIRLNQYGRNFFPQ